MRNVWLCDFCDEEFGSPETAGDHERTEHPPEPHPCWCSFSIRDCPATRELASRVGQVVDVSQEIEGAGVFTGLRSPLRIVSVSSESLSGDFLTFRFAEP